MNRNEYGALTASSLNQADISIINAALALASQAAAKKKIPAAFDAMAWERINSRIGTKRTGEAVHHELYDIAQDGRSALVCCRAVEGTRYGIKTISKDYFIVRKHGAGVRVEQANKAIAAKAAKQAGDGMGLAIAICEGKANLRAPSTTAPRIGYKLVIEGADGKLRSVWDCSPWPVGVRRGEAATSNHTGGFYYFATLDQALDAAAANAVFSEVHEHSRLAILEVEATGNEYQHYGNKLCATYLKPLRVIGHTI